MVLIWKATDMTDRLQEIEQRLAPLRTTLLNHPVYQEIDRLEALRLFMAHHVFAVWDFMSLLKALQRRLCCVEIPWLPVADPTSSRLMNEIVLAEESDDDGQGGFLSHFELYRRAMARCGADTVFIDGFLAQLRQGKSVSSALESPAVPSCVRPFVRQTFDIIECGELCAIAAAFTFGREGLLPLIFQRIVDELNLETNGSLAEFKYYLDRHIGLDGDEHGPMANRLLQSLCGSDESNWKLAEQTAIDSLRSRSELWDGIYDAIRSKKDLAAR
jgi:hypothetical protein